MIALRTRLRRAWAAFWMPLPHRGGPRITQTRGGAYLTLDTPPLAAWAFHGSGSLVSLPPLRSIPDDVTLGFEDAPEQMFPVTRRR